MPQSYLTRVQQRNEAFNLGLQHGHAQSQLRQQQQAAAQRQQIAAQQAALEKEQSRRDEFAKIALHASINAQQIANKDTRSYQEDKWKALTQGYTKQLDDNEQAYRLYLHPSNADDWTPNTLKSAQDEISRIGQIRQKLSSAMPEFGNPKINVEQTFRSAAENYTPNFTPELTDLGKQKRQLDVTAKQAQIADIQDRSADRADRATDRDERRQDRFDSKRATLLQKSQKPITDLSGAIGSWYANQDPKTADSKTLRTVKQKFPNIAANARNTFTNPELVGDDVAHLGRDLLPRFNHFSTPGDVHSALKYLQDYKYPSSDDGRKLQSAANKFHRLVMGDATLDDIQSEGGVK